MTYWLKRFPLATPKSAALRAIQRCIIHRIACIVKQPAAARGVQSLAADETKRRQSDRKKEEQ